MAGMTALLAEATRSLVLPCRSGTPLLQLTDATVPRTLKAMMLAGRPLERSDMPVGLTDDMMALVELAVLSPCRWCCDAPKTVLWQAPGCWRSTDRLESASKSVVPEPNQSPE